MNATAAERLIAEQDELVRARANMMLNAHMYPSGRELFRTFQRIDARHAEIQRQLDAD